MNWIKASERHPYRKQDVGVSLDVHANVVIREKVDGGWRLDVVPLSALMSFGEESISRIEWLEGSVSEVTQ